MASIIEEGPVEKPELFGENAEITERFTDREAPEWKPGHYGPRFLQRPMPESRTKQYGPPFEVRPGPLPRQYQGIHRMSPMDHPGIGSWGVFNDDTTCGEWAKNPVNAWTIGGNKLVAGTTPCTDPSFFGAAWCDPAKACANKCVTKVLAPDFAGTTLVAELAGSTGDLLLRAVQPVGSMASSVAAAARAAGITDGVQATVDEYKRLIAAYQSAKATLTKLSSSPLPETVRAKVAKLRGLEATLDSAVATGKAAGLGIVDPISITLIVVTGAGIVVIAAFALKFFKDYMLGTKALSLCESGSKQITDPKARAEYMARCVKAAKTEEVPDWLIGGGVALGLGVAAYVAYRLYWKR